MGAGRGAPGGTGSCPVTDTGTHARRRGGGGGGGAAGERGEHADRQHGR